MFTAEEIEECDIFPKKLTPLLIMKIILYSVGFLTASVLIYAFYSGRDLISIIKLESLMYNSDTYFMKKLFKLVLFAYLRTISTITTMPQ